MLPRGYPVGDGVGTDPPVATSIRCLWPPSMTTMVEPSLDQRSSGLSTMQHPGRCQTFLWSEPSTLLIQTCRTYGGASLMCGREGSSQNTILVPSGDRSPFPPV